ncbi:MAG: hypothetical protein KAI24_02545 [Planctomycetes bacterium]|nr:hypothetical protein [Planctomycetota bacterium]
MHSFDVPGVNGLVEAATTWDPDGPGPLGARVVYGGNFTVAGTVVASYLAAFDPATASWSTVGGGVNAPVTMLLGLPNGQLLVGGDFSQAGGVPAQRVALFDGTNWQPLGPGLSAPAQPFLQGLMSEAVLLQNGDLVVCGAFTHAAAVQVNGVARWDGTQWQPLGTGLNGPLGPRGSAVVQLPNGDVIVGGRFSSAGGGPAANLARWNGSNWSAVSSSGPNNVVESLAVTANGRLIVGGSFQFVGGILAPYVAAWDGTNWSALGGGLASTVHALAALPSGDVYAGTLHNNLPGPFTLQRFDGNSWLPCGSGAAVLRRVFAITATANGDIYCGGMFDGYGPYGPDAANVARWRQSSGTWSALGLGGPDAAIQAIATAADGSLVIGGSFSALAGTPTQRVARRDHTGWHPLGAGCNGGVLATLVLDNGDVVVGGAFSSPAPAIARFDGTIWHPFGTGIVGTVRALTRRANGNLIAAGQFTSAGGVPAVNIAEWNGTTWQPLGTGLQGPDLAVVQALAWLPNGDLVAAGSSSGPSIAHPLSRWNGFSWTSMGAVSANFPPSIVALAALENGDLLIGGSFSTIGGVSSPRVARWNGSSWASAGAGSPPIGVRALLSLPNDDVLAGGSNGLFRLRDGLWTTVPGSINGGVEVLAWSPAGTAVIAGTFTSVAGAVSNRLVELTTTCPATTTSIPTTCIGPAGPMQLTATPGPWLGGTMVSRCTGFTTNSLGVAVFGLGNPSLPLSLVHPLALPGCELVASADIVFNLSPASGSATISVPFPALAFLAGLPLYHQHVQLSTDALGTATSMSSSNGLLLILGVF